MIQLKSSGYKTKTRWYINKGVGDTVSSYEKYIYLGVADMGVAKE